MFLSALWVPQIDMFDMNYNEKNSHRSALAKDSHNNIPSWVDIPSYIPWALWKPRYSLMQLWCPCALCWVQPEYIPQDIDLVSGVAKMASSWAKTQVCGPYFQHLRMWRPTHLPHLPRLWGRRKSVPNTQVSSWDISFWMLGFACYLHFFWSFMFSKNTHKPVSPPGLSVSKHQLQELSSVKTAPARHKKMSQVPEDLVRTLSSRWTDWLLGSPSSISEAPWIQLELEVSNKRTSCLKTTLGHDWSPSMSKYDYLFFFAVPQESGENLKNITFGCFLQARNLLKDYLSVKQNHTGTHTALSLTLFLKATQTCWLRHMKCMCKHACGPLNACEKPDGFQVQNDFLPCSLTSLDE